VSSTKTIHKVKTITTFISALFLNFLLTIPVFAQDYLISSQDVIKISVFEYPDLTTEARVSDDGKITFPLLGEIEVKNLTTRNIKRELLNCLPPEI